MGVRASHDWRPVEAEALDACDAILSGVSSAAAESFPDDAPGMHNYNSVSRRKNCLNFCNIGGVEGPESIEG